MAIEFVLNGEAVSVDADPKTPLLEVLRNDIELNGPKFGCGLAQCGACAVLLDGTSIRSCVLPVQSVDQIPVVVASSMGHPNPLEGAEMSISSPWLL